MITAHTHTRTRRDTHTYTDTHTHTHTRTYTETRTRANTHTHTHTYTHVHTRTYTLYTGEDGRERLFYDDKRTSVQCPESYNQHMGGVDRVTSSGDITAAEPKFYKYIFMFDVAITNAYILYKDSHDTRTHT